MDNLYCELYFAVIVTVIVALYSPAVTTESSPVGPHVTDVHPINSVSLLLFVPAVAVTLISVFVSVSAAFTQVSFESEPVEDSGYVCE